MKIFYFLFLIFTISYSISFAQEIEPRNYANVPKGLNVAALTYSLSSGNIVSDASAPIKDLKLTSHTIILTYLRSFSLFGKLAKISASMPYVFIGGNAKINGKDTSATRSGFADARIKFGINLFGSPALAPKDFPKYKEKLIFGMSVVIAVPTGQYLTDKLINIGSNRWGFKTELGLSKKYGAFYFEIYSGIWLFTKNKEYLKTNTLEQNPIFSFQGHIAYTFPSKIWIALNGALADGGETKLNGTVRNDFQKNWRFGATLSFPIGMQHSIKILAHTGVATRSGGDFSILSLAYQYSWF